MLFAFKNKETGQYLRQTVDSYTGAVESFLCEVPKVTKSLPIFVVEVETLAELNALVDKIKSTNSKVVKTWCGTLGIPRSDYVHSPIDWSKIQAIQLF